MPVNINTVGTSGIGSSGGSSCSLINDISVETKFHINGGFSFNDGFIRNSLIGTNTSFKYRQDDLYKYNMSYPSYTFYMMEISIDLMKDVTKTINIMILYMNIHV